jgi:hypothetical protein
MATRESAPFAGATRIGSVMTLGVLSAAYLSQDEKKEQ